MALAGIGIAIVGQLSGSAAVSAVRLGGGPATLEAQASGGRGSTPGGRQAPNGLAWEWWNDAEVQKELALSADKVKQINDFFNRRNADLSPIVHDFVKQSAELDKMTRDRVVDEGTYALQVMRVEAGRARLSESRTLMLYRMYRLLTPGQHQQLQGLLDRRFNRGGRGRSASEAR
jgi:Spy/CpxP family protein refolding chaperone